MRVSAVFTNRIFIPKRSPDYALATQTLWFTRVDRFVDPYESQLPKADRKVLEKKLMFDPRWRIAEVHLADYQGNAIGPGGAEKIEMMRTPAGIARLLRIATFANCWQANDNENAGMWDLYGIPGETVAITSTLDRIVSALADEPRRLSAAKVAYIDYRSESILDANGDLNHISLCATKRNYYSHEQEVRLFTIDASMSDADMRGMPIRCATDALIKGIHIDPLGTTEFVRKVAAMARKYDLPEPNESDIYTNPED